MEKISRRMAEAREQEPLVSDAVQSAAVKYGEEFFTGKTIDDAKLALEAQYPDYEEQGGEVQSGFMTEGGRFVNRAEAFDILIREGELKNAAKAE